MEAVVGDIQVSAATFLFFSVVRVALTSIRIESILRVCRTESFFSFLLIRVRIHPNIDLLARDGSDTIVNL